MNLVISLYAAHHLTEAVFEERESFLHNEVIKKSCADIKNNIKHTEPCQGAQDIYIYIFFFVVICTSKVVS